MWSRSLDIGLCDRLCRPSLDGSLSVYQGEAYYSHGAASITFIMSRSSNLRSSNYLYFTLYGGSHTGYWNYGALDIDGVAIDCTSWSRSSYIVYNGSLWAIISDGSLHADDYQYSALYSNGVASVCFRCGRGVVTVVTVIVFGVLHLVEFRMMYTVVLAISSELPLMFILFFNFQSSNSVTIKRHSSSIPVLIHTTIIVY